MDTETVKIFIFGRVQGVFFRAFIKEKANFLGIKGYTRNISNGSIEVVSQGNNENLKKFIKFIKKGPKSAKIEKIKVSHETNKKIYNNFIIYTKLSTCDVDNLDYYKNIVCKMITFFIMF